MPKRKIYMAVTKDALSLPLAVARQCCEAGGAARGAGRNHTILNFQREDGKDQASRIHCGRGGGGRAPNEGRAAGTEGEPPQKQTGEFDGEIFQERIRQLREKKRHDEKGFCRLYRNSVHHAIQLREEKTVPGGGHAISDCVCNGLLGGLADWAEGGRRKMPKVTIYDTKFCIGRRPAAQFQREGNPHWENLKP